MSSNPASVDPLGDRLLQFFCRKPAETLEERTRRRVSMHLIPVLFLLYILAYLDRVNVSAAQLKMQLPLDEQGLGITREIIGFGAGLFFWGYWILEIPSTAVGGALGSPLGVSAAFSFCGASAPR